MSCADRCGPSCHLTTPTRSDNPDAVTSASGFQGIYRSAASPKRRAEVQERLHWGETPNRIATDLGISRGAVAEILEQLRAEGAAEPSPSGN